MRIPLTDAGISSPYLQEYLTGAAPGAGPSPRDEGAWRDAAEKASSWAGAAAMWEAAGPENEALGLPAPQVGALRISTGQQVRLFGSPLFLVYKVLTAAALASWCRGSLGIYAQAVFMSETEDDDWDEVRTARWLDARGKVREASLPPGEDGVPIGLRPLAGVERALDALEGDLAGPGAGAAVARLRSALDPEGSYTDGHHRLLADGALGRLGVPFLPGSLTAKKEAGAVVLARLIEVWGGAREALAEGTAALEAAGIKPPVAMAPDRLPLFHLFDGRRHRVRTHGERAVSEAGHDWALADLPQAIRDEPLAWGPHVVSRPLIRDATAKSLAVVLGPGELAYHAQMAGMWDVVGVPRPLLVPRLSATVLEPAAKAVLETIADLPLLKRDPAGAVSAFGKARLGGLGDRIEAAREEVAATLEPLYADLAESLPGLRPTVDRVRKQMDGPLEKLARQAGMAAAEGDGGLVEGVRNALWPGGRPQERALCPAWAEARFGAAWADSLTEEVTPCPDRHVVAFPPTP